MAAKQLSPEHLQRDVVGVEEWLLGLPLRLAELEVSDTVDQREETEPCVEEVALHAIELLEPSSRLPARDGVRNHVDTHEQYAECSEPDQPPGRAFAPGRVQ